MLVIDYNHLTNIIIPVKKRTIERYDWMRLHSFPLVTLNENLDADTNEDVFSALHNNQILSLEHYLNSVLSPITPIFITDGTWLDETYLYQRDELFSTEIFLYTRAEGIINQYIYPRISFDDQQVDYIVHLSGSDAGLETKLINFVNEFNPGGKIFNVFIDGITP